MKNHIDVIGSGVNVTTLVANYDRAGLFRPVVGLAAGRSSRLANLSIRNFGSITDLLVGIGSAGGSSGDLGDGSRKVDSVKIEIRGGRINYGLYLEDPESTDLRELDIDVNIPYNQQGAGVNLYRSNTNIEDTDIKMICHPNTISCFGVESNNSGMQITDSSVSISFNGVLIQAKGSAALLKVFSSKLRRGKIDTINDGEIIISGSTLFLTTIGLGNPVDEGRISCFNSNNNVVELGLDCRPPAVVTSTSIVTIPK